MFSRFFIDRPIFITPSTITRSPPFRPELITQRSPDHWPASTGRGSAWPLSFTT